MKAIVISFTFLAFFVISDVKAESPDTSLSKAGQLYEQAENEYFFGDLDSAKLYYLEAYNIWFQYDSLDKAADCLINVGIIAEIYGEYHWAEDLYLQSFDLYRKQGNSEGIAMALNNIGILFADLGNYEKAYHYFYYSLLIEEHAGNLPGIAYSLNNIGLLCRKMGMLDKSADYYEKSLHIKYSYKDSTGIALTLINQGKVYEELGDLDDALKNYEKALELNTAIQDREGMATALNNIGVIFLLKEEFDKSVLYFTQALEFRSEIDNTAGVISSLTGLGRSLIALGQFGSADAKLLEALKLAIEIENSEMHANVLLILAELRSKESNFSEAYQYLLQYNELKEELVNSENSSHVLELEARYENEKKESRIEIQNAQIDARDARIRQERILRYGIIAFAVLLVLVLFVIVRMYRMKAALNSILGEKNQELQELNATKNKFFSIISHDLRNPFGALRNVSEMLHVNYDDLDEAQRKSLAENMKDLSANAGELLENLLQWSLSQSGKLEPEPEKFDITNLLQKLHQSLEPMAVEKNIEFVFSDAEAVQIFGDQKMLETVVRNLIQNAIKFTPENGQIVIKSAIEGNDLRVEVQDSGIGISKDDCGKLFKIEHNHKKIGSSPNKGSGLGLILCREFVEANNGRIGVESELGKGSTFYFYVPLYHE
jgi:signal transduction histidine kinase